MVAKGHFCVAAVVSLLKQVKTLQKKKWPQSGAKYISIQCTVFHVGLKMTEKEKARLIDLALHHVDILQKETSSMSYEEREFFFKRLRKEIKNIKTKESVPIANFISPAQQSALDELIRAYNETGDDHHRLFTAAMVGDANGPHRCMTLHIHRGLPDGETWPNGSSAGGGLAEGYDAVRDVLKKGIEANPPFYDAQDGFDIGPKEDSWFVLVDDCQNEEWNAFWNKKNVTDIWQKRKITFAELYEKVKNMVVAPPNPDAEYHWYDRVD